MENNDKRRTEIKRGWMWKPYNFMDLKKGDIFRLFDEDDNPIEIGSPYIAIGDAYLNKAKVGSINCETYEEEEKRNNINVSGVPGGS